MTQPLVRLYASQQTATAAVTELQEHGFSADAIHVVSKPAAAPAVSSADTETPSAPPASASSGSVADELVKLEIPPEHAAIYAQGVQRGEVLVAVNPPFGYARMATGILDSHDPAEVAELPEVAPTTRPAARSKPIDWNSAAPFSSWMGWRVLLNDPTPLSNYFKWRVLKEDPEASSSLEGIRKQSNDAAPLSSKIGMPVLSNNPAPLSTKFGWRLLWDKATPLSDKLQRRVLFDDPTPLSSKFGWRLLLDNPTPLSTKFGWRLLSNNPAPLSSWLGLKVLSKD